MLLAGGVLFSVYLAITTAVLANLGSIAVMIGLSLLFLGIQFKLGTWMALRSAGARDIPDDAFIHITRITEELSANMGIRPPRLMYARMGGLNAFAVGRKGKGTIVLGMELIELLTPEELEGVIAHELAHLKNRDVVMMVVGQSVALAIAWTMFFGIRQSVKGAKGYLIAWFSATLAHMFVMLFVLVFSRAREYAADSDAAHYTGNPQALISALSKVELNHQRHGRTDVEKRLGALCLFGRDSGLLAALFATHPPIEKRIQRLRQHPLNHHSKV